jgi:uncharacterized membrane protein YhiD involved in acid resistance
MHGEWDLLWRLGLALVLATAAGVWLVAAVGMAAGGGLAVLAIAYLLVTTTSPMLARQPVGDVAARVRELEGVLLVNTAESDPD